MENLALEPTDKTLGVRLDAEKGLLEISGMFYSDRARDFFQPIKEWLETYMSEVGRPLTLNLKILYLNSTSTKNLMDIMEMLESFHDSGGEATINWYYEEDDDILEMGRELAEDTILPFHLIPYD